ncbi:MAG: N-acetyl-gamma-glutamyl-phosphate reductase [Acidimicrobiia bacterium]|nr:N-acetyl-gamma-glutamyl-phosphate reductase [Acidimicrobiia bacterium]MXZ79267.1 N-acetyl-gamma-glutamyl-phosphate reductase [Acidimicrobiia bacterium]MXZ86263.1 N-acetyl-gamma-glutamyl-phosphate reductase [Acidimicrobiia bacterium]MYB72950.1 N-acetyl-gamma-glutamyl-phosphate reductase [Acidimicrobiia bacterium]MYE73350.1 N-acetyl-gamma-glutamyl-phosphate reductase [Acidimicrobiia bacterium]
MGQKIPVGIIGASGYVGAELMRLLVGHRGFDVGFVTGDTQAGQPVADLYPHLAAIGAEQEFVKYDSHLLDDVALAFLALPHGQSMALAGDVLDRGKVAVDLAADFRLKDSGLYQQWYGEPHQTPELLGNFAYGLPELFRDELAGATAVAVPGCYPTAAALAIAPLVRTGLIQPEGIIVDAASGVSGAGRPPKDHTTFCAVDEDFTAYGLLDHRHTPEIEQAAGASVLFTPHLAPMNRGILATCYSKPAAETSTDALLAALSEFYADEPFVVVSDRSPSTKATLGSNAAHLTACYDARTNTVVALCAIDNLVKGAAGQAIQCANLISGLDEATGLTAVGVYP